DDHEPLGARPPLEQARQRAVEEIALPGALDEPSDHGQRPRPRRRLEHQTPWIEAREALDDPGELGGSGRVELAVARLADEDDVEARRAIERGDRVVAVGEAQAQPLAR